MTPPNKEEFLSIAEGYYAEFESLTESSNFYDYEKSLSDMMQKLSCEYMEKQLNKLIRQYIPKKSNFNELNHQNIKKIQYKINNRPRKNLNFNSPKEIFFLNLQNKKLHSHVETTIDEKKQQFIVYPKK